MWPVNPAADVFSFSMLCWEIFSCQTPLGDLMPRQVLKAILAGERPPILPCIPIIFQRLLQACWHGEYQKRPQMDKIIRIINAPMEKLLQYEPVATHPPQTSQSPGGVREKSPGLSPQNPLPTTTNSPTRRSPEDQKSHHVLTRLIDLLSAPYAQSQIKALKAIANIAPTLSNPAVVKESGIVPLIVNLQTGTEDVKEHVLVALLSICSHQGLCDVAVEAGAIGVCMTTLHSQNNILVLNSLKVCFLPFTFGPI